MYIVNQDDVIDDVIKDIGEGFDCQIRISGTIMNLFCGNIADSCEGGNATTTHGGTRA